ncbi:uncharacterized protein LOC133179016 [Saccostrea echinata]|uniref:uncharacterized protein LOC133179016 n=1 Tax=Saccostrea echinata TaxID=191078 RepID=UPI002A8099A6|nr:uncharacterized protein LOC133179016 [Saccostrea echinata]
MSWILCALFACFSILEARHITKMTQSGTCFTHNIISSANRECKTDMDCDSYMACCQHTRNNYSVCVPYKGKAISLANTRQSNSMNYKNNIYKFHLPQPSPIPRPFLDESSRRMKS